MTWPADTVKQVVFLSGWRTLCVGVSGLAVLALAGAMAWYTAHGWPNGGDRPADG